MVLTDLKAMATQLGLKGTSTLRKGDLIAAIAAHQNGSGTKNGQQSGAQPAKAATNGNPEPTLDLNLPPSPAADTAEPAGRPPAPSACRSGPGPGRGHHRRPGRAPGSSPKAAPPSRAGRPGPARATAPRPPPPRPTG